MPITVEKAVKINSAIEKFFKAIGRAERIRNRINRLAEENYKTFLPKVRAWMEFTNREINKAFSRKYIRKSIDGKTEYYAWIDFQKDKAIDITTKLLDWEKLDEAGKRMLKPAGLDIMAKSGDEAYKIAGIEASFDILNPEAVKAVDRICSKAVKEVGKETKQAINHIIREGIKEGKSMGRVAKELRPLVGLTERQVKAVANYDKWLIKKRPDLSDLKRAQWVERYNKKLHRYRTDMIARTESMRATNEGNLIGYKEAGYATVRWSANVGACEQCDAESGHVYTIEESRGMLPLHPDCRCSWLPESKVKPRVPRVPIVPIVPRRGHLPGDMKETRAIEQIMSDAKAARIPLSQGEAMEIRGAIRDYTSALPGQIRLVQSTTKFPTYWTDDMIKAYKREAAAIEKYLKLAPKYKRESIYRGLKLNYEEINILKNGQMMDLRGIASFGDDAQHAYNYGNTRLIVKNKTGVSVTHLSQYPGEKEILFSKNAKFKIVKIRRLTGTVMDLPKYDIYLNEIVPKVPKPVVPKVPKVPKVPLEVARKSLEGYQDGAFQSINGYLRGEKIDPKYLTKVKQDVLNMNSLVKKATDDYYLYRGDGAGISANIFEKISGLPHNIKAEEVLFGKIKGKSYTQFLNEKLKGITFTDNAFISTTKDVGLAIDNFVGGSTSFSKYGVQGMAEIMTPKGTMLIDVEKVSLMGAKESEMILAKGLKYKIENVSIEPFPSEGREVRFYIKYILRIVK